MRWRVEADREIKTGWKTATCPHCGCCRPVEQFRFETVKERIRGGGNQNTRPVQVIRDCDMCR